MKYKRKPESEDDQRTLSKLFDQMSAVRQDNTVKLYTIASKFRMAPQKTLETIKRINKFNTRRKSMEYYKIVIHFRDLLMEKTFELPNIFYYQFLDVLVYLAVDHNTDVVIDFMNIIEEKMYRSQTLTKDNKTYIRMRLLEMSRVAELEVITVQKK